MEPVEQARTEVPEAPPDDVAHPFAISASVSLGILLTVGLGYLLQRYERPTDAPIALQGPAHVEIEAPSAVAAPVAPPAPPAAPPAPSLFELFQSALARSRDVMRAGIDKVFGRPVDPASMEELEEILLRADVGVPTTDLLVQKVRAAAAGGVAEPEQLREVLRAEMRRILGAVHRPLVPGNGLWVVLVVGVNGSGKTTTIGKLSARLAGEGRKVLLAAGDTYRAAAEQQLGVWAERAGVEIVALEQGADPGAVAFTAVERAKAQGFDVVIVDTAGRLQTRKPLMEQLGKIRRVLDKALPGAPHETLLVVDGTMGQNALSQARLFHEVTQLTGVAVTKLDGTAKGGMVLSIANELRVPVKLVGLGEKVADLRDFDPDAFVEALA
jgi:fused signal recognition particle receptor